METPVEGITHSLQEAAQPGEPSLLQSIRNQLLTSVQDSLSSSRPRRVLEISCGYGHILLSLAELRPDLDDIENEDQVEPAMDLLNVLIFKTKVLLLPH
jgi:tRNA G46 methylase TrmB